MVKLLAMVCTPIVCNYVLTCAATLMPLTQWESMSSEGFTHLGEVAGMVAGMVVVVAKG